MSPEPPPVAVVSDGTLNIPHDPPPPYPSRDRRQRRRRTTLEVSSADSDDFTFPGSAHAGHHPDDETTPLLGGVSSPTRRPRTMSLSSAASISPSLAQTVVSAFRMDLDSDMEYADDTSHGLSAEGPLHDDHHLSHTPGTTRRRSQGYRARWRSYFRPIGRRAYWSALLHLLVFNFPYALFAWIYLFVFTLVSKVRRAVCGVKHVLKTLLCTYCAAVGYHPPHRAPPWCCTVLFRSPWREGTRPR